ncbi:putative 2-phosphosulfolactate phosphatase [Paenibacillus baekrokdamisoli]|uniref:Probable 2-phosphosulfolactate phosphatase n=2 Tax=Paenibacillus baekrokdamisoli TaxID=1712516 RepID=A0A3G9JD33_9BACL|nr:2-phosphosulfolactate phosphatase [Paenibacillus baekrokdamisoli]MBB3070112.1 2-phosphosulfolactate phosphatase [Paenibacillus baekrokdamisoli]BBH21124.1 putative 2-phosphosulfolactate phosphatase [Paenibacillus baekrokdamisoli]
MEIVVISSVNEAQAECFTHRTAIVIDVLRATSTMITALQSGASGVYPVETVLEARTLQQEGDLLAGERFCRKIPGFDLGNSPEDFTPEVVKDRRILLTTTNGTRAIHKALRADNVLAGAIINASACARMALELKRDIVLLCAGSHDDFALEDGLCAGLFIDRLQALSGIAVETDDFGAAMLGLYKNASTRILEPLHRSSTGKRLLKMGYGRDIERCGQIDSSIIVPRMQGDMIVQG